MCLEANRDMTHREMQELVYQHCYIRGWVTVKEARLKNGRIADILAMRNGYVMVVEIKTIARYSLMMEAYNKYAEQCDILVIAAPDFKSVDPLLYDTQNWNTSYLRKLGLWQVTWEGIKVRRGPLQLGWT